MVNITILLKKFFSNLIFCLHKYYLPYIHFLSGNYSGKYTMQVSDLRAHDPKQDLTLPKPEFPLQ